MRRLWLIACSLALMPLNHAPSAQERNGVEAQTFIPGEPIHRVAPSYPPDALAEGIEGWVDVSFVVSPTGEVGEAMVEDSSGVKSLERAALASVRTWTYKPATRDGEPVEQSIVHSQIKFTVDGQTGASKPFQNVYNEALAHIKDGDVAAAKPLIEKLEMMGRTTLFEDAWLWWLRYAYLQRTQSTDTKAEITALQRALGYQEDYLAPQTFVVAAQNLYVLELRAGDFSKAREIYRRLRDSKTAMNADSYEQVMAALKPTADEIDEILASDKPLVSRGEIGDNDYWVHNLLRRSFGLNEIHGRIDVVDVRCKRGTKRYDAFPADAV